MLAWLGGVAVLAGLAFLLTIAVSRGWIGEGARTAMAGVLSLALLGAGVWLRERAPTEASLAAAAVGIAGPFGTLVVAGPSTTSARHAGVAGAFATGAVATALAIHWRAQVMGWLGLLGALWAPTALGAFDGGGMVFLAIAFAATIAVLVWQRWTTLGGLRLRHRDAAVARLGLFDTSSTLALVVFGVLDRRSRSASRPTAAAAPVAIGPEARTRPPVRRRRCSAQRRDPRRRRLGVLDGEPWLVALAVAHIALGLAATRVARISRELALIMLAIGVVIANIAFAVDRLRPAAGDRLGLLRAPLRRAARRPLGRPRHDRARRPVIGRPEDEAAARADRILAMAGLSARSRSPASRDCCSTRRRGLAGPLASDRALAAAGALASSPGPAGGSRARAGAVLDALALAASRTSPASRSRAPRSPPTLAAQALGLAALARRNDDRFTGWAAVAFAALALLHALGTLATARRAARRARRPRSPPPARCSPSPARCSRSAAPRSATTDARRSCGRRRARLLYLASVEVVTLAGAGAHGPDALSVLWALAGVGALCAACCDDRALRRAALVLLA